MEINHLVSLGYPHDYGNLQITGDLTIAFGPRWPPGKPPLQDDLTWEFSPMGKMGHFYRKAP